MKRKIDINCDLGESYGHFKMGQDEKIMPHITSANIACGFHAGDPLTMAYTVELAKKYKVAVGAHPGYPDLLGFGRREMKLSQEELKSCIFYQIGALQAFAKISGVNVQHVKPHGALYNVATKDESTAKAIAEAVQSVSSQLIVFAPPNSAAARIAQKIGQPVAFEAFADRAYNSDGTLVPRSKPNAVIEDPEQVVERVVKMVTEGTVSAVNKKTVNLGEVHTVCIHGDTPTAVESIRNLRKALKTAKIEVQPVNTFLKTHKEK